jgi:hypothetical protein
VKSLKNIYGLCFLIACLLPGMSSYGQEIFDNEEVYQTKGGQVTISMDYGYTSTLFQSNELHVQLNYDNAMLMAVLSVNTLVNTAIGDKGVGTDFPFSEITLTGKFGVDHIETSNHEPLQFEFSGVLAENQQEIPVQGSAELQHIGGGGDISCLLGFTITLDKSSLPAEFVFSEDLQEVRIQVLQTILNRRN